MPEAYAKRLAKLLTVDCKEDFILADVPEPSFAEAVVSELEKLGFTVERDPFKPYRLKIIKSGAIPEETA